MTVTISAGDIDEVLVVEDESDHGSFRLAVEFKTSTLHVWLNADDLRLLQHGINEALARRATEQAAP